ncbi:hypothetical protein KEM48_001239 [Puccinia striiformis f. sp. tritici PST-130]|nr:hypothetical protein KEM48_001239 [Puccinia striiformis f. sp. tritici PST-130]
MRFTVAAVASFTLLSSVSAGLPFGQLLSPGGGIPVVGGLIPGQTAGSGNVVACGNMLGSVLNVGALNTNTCGSTGNNQAGGNAIYCGQRQPTTPTPLQEIRLNGEGEPGVKGFVVFKVIDLLNEGRFILIAGRIPTSPDSFVFFNCVLLLPSSFTLNVLLPQPVLKLFIHSF